MIPQSPDPLDNPQQQAIADRLAKLRTLPVDTSRLDRAIRAAIPSAPPHRWWRPLAAVAASLLVVATIALVFLPGRPVQASPDAMAQMHNDMVSGKIPTMQFDSIDNANRAIAAMAADAPQLPSAPAEHEMACCIRKVGNKKVTCVLLKNAGVPVTISVAHAADVTRPKNATAQTVDGVTYYIETVGNLHMVMLNDNGNWICLISEAPDATLISLAARLRQ
jgi:hypothetical protein